MSMQYIPLMHTRVRQTWKRISSTFWGKQGYEYLSIHTEAD